MLYGDSLFLSLQLNLLRFFLHGIILFCTFEMNLKRYDMKPVLEFDEMNLEVNPISGEAVIGYMVRFSESGNDDASINFCVEFEWDNGEVIILDKYIRDCEFFQNDGSRFKACRVAYNQIDDEQLSELIINKIYEPK